MIFLSSYSEMLLLKPGSVLLKTQRLCDVAYKVFKTCNDPNSNFMRDAFCRSSDLTHRIENICVYSKNTVKFGNKGLT